MNPLLSVNGRLQAVSYTSEIFRSPLKDMTYESISARSVNGFCDVCPGKNNDTTALPITVRQSRGRYRDYGPGRPGSVLLIVNRSCPAPNFLFWRAQAPRPRPCSRHALTLHPVLVPPPARTLAWVRFRHLRDPRRRRVRHLKDRQPGVAGPQHPSQREQGP